MINPVKDFEEAYKDLNPAQKEAVDTLDGPVLVVAGPGTGKTQVLSIRIANILKKTDTGASGILCLTFTRAGVRAMRERLESYIGPSARQVTISTFHSFAQDIVSKHYRLLDIDDEPTLLDDSEAVLLSDELLQNGNFEYLRPRGNPSQYFHDLKSLISLMKRERMSPFDFMSAIDSEIKSLENDPESISSRGPSKGQIKKEIEKRIEGLSRTREVVEFYEKYEALKMERAYMDYDDVLSFATRIIESSDDVRDEIREKFLYVLVDEHQDSSGIQNAFLKAIWGEVEKPNIFVVGDDRQLIYGFSGASLSYFEEFTHYFGKAHVITLLENYRSTKQILSLADTLLKSTLTDGALRSNKKTEYPVSLFEYSYSRDEILGAGLYFKKKIEEGLSPSECALLLPKNKHVRSATALLRNLGLPVSSESTVSLFEMRDTEEFMNVLRVLVNPYDSISLSKIILSEISGVPKIDAHKFLFEKKDKEINIETLLNLGNQSSLFTNQNHLAKLGLKLKELIEHKDDFPLNDLILKAGNVFLIESANDAELLGRRVEVLRTFTYMATTKIEKGEKYTLEEFLGYTARLESYGHIVPVATFSGGEGIRVQTLHASKGLEYECVWIAHMNESIVLSSKKNAFTLPAIIEEKIEARDEAVARREIYVAVTRAKSECTISYGKMGNDARPLEMLGLLTEVPEIHFVKKDNFETEKELLLGGPQVYVKEPFLENTPIIDGIKNIVKENYGSKKVSVTLLNNFFECPWKWYFRNFLQLPELKTDSLIFGSAVHKTIEEILKRGGTPTEKFVKEVLESALQKEGIHEKAKLTRLLREGLLAVSNFVNGYYKNIGEDYSTERSISYKDPSFPHLQMYGKIDLTERLSDGSMSVTDFKTGTVKTPSVIEKEGDNGKLSDYLRQLAMYSYLIEGAEKGVSVSSSKLLFLEAKKADVKNSLYSTHIEKETIDVLVADISEYDEALRNGEWMERECNFKPYGAGSSECPNCALMERFK
jgi:DNA helicase-2/ATP-dependent DNA helicase PcrA